MKRMKRVVSIMMFIALITACARDDDTTRLHQTEWLTKKIAVILPMSPPLDTHWKRTLALCNENLRYAFGTQPKGINLEFEWYDENESDIKEIARSLAEREDIAAVIGALYSVNTHTLASSLTKTEKPFFTLATTAELVRAYSSAGGLWAMTETDITQCEMLLSKALYYGASSVALLADHQNSYGKTFVEWFGFQAREFGLEVKGIFDYSPETLSRQSLEAAGCGADFVICAPSEIDHIRTIEEAFHQYNLKTGTAPRRLYSDTAYGDDVIKRMGAHAEGLEGIGFGADAKSGFEVSYKEFFGEAPTVGEPQIYDAVMLLGYAFFYQTLHTEITLDEALRKIVDGRDESTGSWMAKDMRGIIEGLAKGKHPDVSGASGPLEFDSKVYTNVLSTTYYHFEIYNGRYIILDYNTGDKNKRKEATLAAWDRLSTKKQTFDDNKETPNAYPPVDDRWALLVATSSGWSNYRHQADVLNMYQILKRHGYKDNRIVLIIEDDIAHHTKNPQPGVVQVRIGGENVYDKVEVDYRTSQLEPEDIRKILCGERSERLPQVIEADKDDNILVFWSGHGRSEQLQWLNKYRGFTYDMAKETFIEMNRNERYRKMLWLIETCYSGSVAKACESIPGILCVTAADENETSKADIFNTDLGVWMSNRFTSTLQDCITDNPSMSLRDLYNRLFINTVGSHVMVYNAPQYGNMYRNTIEEFLR